jgi:four helix bundle protein
MNEVRENKHAVKTIESYRDLHVWRAAIELAVACYTETTRFPASETYGLTSQIRRSGTSIAANIAEGYGRDQIGSYVQFLRVAQGSLKELETHVIIATRVGYLEPSVESCLLQKSEGVGKMLRALIRGLQRSA